MRDGGQTKRIENGIVVRSAEEALRFIGRTSKIVALEEETYIADNAETLSLAGKVLTQPKAIMEADRVLRDLVTSGALREKRELWLEILAPSLVLYFLSKLLRIHNILSRLPSKVSWRFCSANGMITAMAQGILPEKVIRQRSLLSMGAFRDFLLRTFPRIMSWQRHMRIVSRSNSEGCQFEKKRGGVLFWATNPVHEESALNIAQLLVSDDIPALCITSRNMKMPCVLPQAALCDHTWKRKIKGVVPGLRIFLDEFAQSVIKFLAPETKAFNCMRMSRFLRGQLDRFFVPQAADALALAQRAMEAIEPEAVFIQDIGDYRTRALAWVARERNIPVFHHQQGNVFPDSTIEWGWDIADRHLVWGEWSKAIVIDLGIPVHKIDITGTPRISFPSKHTVAKIRASSGISHVLFPLMPASSLNFGNGGATSLAGCHAIMKMLLEYVEMMDGRVVLQIKPRPLGDHPWFDSFRPALSPQVEIFPNHINIGQALEKTDIVITTHSTVGIDAVMVGKPLVVLDGGYETHPYEDLIQYGAAAKADSAAELKAITENLIFNGASREKMMQCQAAYCRRILRYAGDDSTRRIVDLLKNAISLR